VKLLSQFCSRFHTNSHNAESYLTQIASISASDFTEGKEDT
jgi:hypothetical protein